MKVLLFGATGMVGQGVLRECLLDPDVDLVQTVGRTSTGTQHAKLREVVLGDMSSYAAIESQLSGFDACFFCLGISSVGMDEADYARITFDITMAAAETLSRLSAGLTFIYVSGAGTDSTERGRVTWARIKGRTENALLRLPFKAAYMFRPGIIQPLHGIRSKTAAYRTFDSDAAMDRGRRADQLVPRRSRFIERRGESRQFRHRQPGDVSGCGRRRERNVLRPREIKERVRDERRVE